MAGLTAPLFSLRARGPVGSHLAYRRRAGSPHVDRARTSYPPLPQQFIDQQSIYDNERVHWRNAPFTPADIAAWDCAARNAPFAATRYTAAMTWFMQLALSHVFHADSYDGRVVNSGPGALLCQFAHTQTTSFAGDMAYGTDPRNLSQVAAPVLLLPPNVHFVVTGLTPGQYWCRFYALSILAPVGVTGIYPVAVH